MKRIFLLSFIAGSLFAAAPPDPAGLIYYESAGTTARTTYSGGWALGGNHVAHGLFFEGTAAPAGVSVTSATTDGTWSYRKLDDKTAELTLTTDQRSRKRTLEFNSNDGGTMLTDDFSVGEFRFVSPATRAPLVNCSNRSFVPAAGSALTGFVVTGEHARTVLVRAIGPGLAPFGISGTLGDPKLAVFRSERMVALNDDWAPMGGSSIRETSSLVGAFPMSPDSKDAALVVTVVPGAYVAEVTSSTMGDSGQVLTEVYLLP